MRKIKLLIFIVCLCIPLSACSWLTKAALDTVTKPKTSNSANLAIGDNKKTYTANANNKKQLIDKNYGQNAGNSITNATGRDCKIYHNNIPFANWLSYWFMALAAFVGWSCPYTPQTIVKCVWRYLFKSKKK